MNKDVEIWNRIIGKFFGTIGSALMFRALLNAKHGPSAYTNICPHYAENTVYLRVVQVFLVF